MVNHGTNFLNEKVWKFRNAIKRPISGLLNTQNQITFTKIIFEWYFISGIYFPSH